MKNPAASVVLVLGQILERDKSLSNSLISRVQTALSIWKRPANSLGSDIGLKYMILTGGDVAGVGISEASAMSKYILDREPKVAANIILEEKSTNTLENALFCKDILVREGCSRVHLVTNEFHIPRAQCIFECVFNPLRIEIICHSAESGLEKGAYRKLEDRPQDPKRWRLCERLDWEVNALQTLNEYLDKYSLGPIDEKRINEALNEIRKLNVTMIV